MESISHILALLSALLGAAGSAILFYGSYTLESFSAGIFGSPEQQKWDNEVKSRNRSRVARQRIGLIALMVGFVCQFVSTVLS